MAKYASNAKAILLNNGKEQLLPVSKAKLIELANLQKGKFGEGVVDVEGALSYLLGQDATNLAAANKHTDDSIAALDSSVAARTGYVLSGITEVDGKLTGYTETWLDASIVSYNGKSNVNTALTDIYGQLAAISGGGTGSIQQQINAAIDALDVAEIKEDGKAIVSVSETDGKIAATAGNVDAQYVDVNNEGNKFKIAGDSPATKLTAQATLEQLQSEINAAVGDAAKYTIGVITDGLDANVAKRYQLLQTIGTGSPSKVGEYIDIPADSTLKEVYLGSADDTVDAATGEVTKNVVDDPKSDPQSMNFVHKLSDGTYSITKIDVSKFFTQSERGAGLVKNGATLAVGLDADSETFLTVEADGIKLSGVQNAIDTAKKAATDYADQKIADLDSEKGKAYTDEETAYVITGVTQVDGVLTSINTVALDDAHVKTTSFANENLAALLGNENLPSNLHEALNKIAGKVSAGAAAAVTEVVGDSDNVYVKVSATKVDNTVTLAVDDSALGNVSKLSYDVLASDVESVTILNANPTV